MILVSVFVGFAPSYYLAGLFNAPLPNVLVHIHGAVFSCWILLLVAQTSLVAAGRVDVHRRLGLLGFGLACLVVILGVLVATESLVTRIPKILYTIRARRSMTQAPAECSQFCLLVRERTA